MMRERRLPLCLALVVISLAATAPALQAQGQITPANPPANPQGTSEPEPSAADKPWVEFDKAYKLPTPQDVAANPAAQVQQQAGKESQDLGNALSDFKRGAGVGLTVAPRGRDRIDGAAVVNGKIAVTQQNTNAARLMFEFHQLFTTNVITSKGRAAARRELKLCEANPIDCPIYGIGPFLAVQTSEDDLIASVGAGIMMGLRSDPRKTTSFNIGIGVQWDTKVKKLADGFVAGQPLPTGEKEIRFKESGEARLMVAFSLAF
jgi:hypothetical protein